MRREIVVKAALETIEWGTAWPHMPPDFLTVLKVAEVELKYGLTMAESDACGDIMDRGTLLLEKGL